MLVIVTVYANPDWQAWKSKHSKKFSNSTEETVRFKYWHFCGRLSWQLFLIINFLKKNLRFNIWKSRHDDATTHNERYAKGLESYTKTTYDFSHLTHEELLHQLTGAKNPHAQRMMRLAATTLKPTTTTLKPTTTTLKPTTTTLKPTTTTLKPTTTAKAAAVDWRTVSGVVQPVKDQGHCGYHLYNNVYVDFLSVSTIRNYQIN